MAKYKGQEVRGLSLDKELVCIMCATEEELRTMTEGQFIYDEMLVKDLGFTCDRCKKRIF